MGNCATCIGVTTSSSSNLAATSDPSGENASRVARPVIGEAASGWNAPLVMFKNKLAKTRAGLFFDKYREADEDAILAQGMERLCHDLSVTPDAFVVFVLAWKFEAENIWCFTRAEFVKACVNLEVFSITSIKAKFQEWLHEVEEKDAFKEMYEWAYSCTLDTGNGQKVLPLDLAIALWKLVFSNNEPPILQRWLHFLEQTTSVRGIPKDTWSVFLSFVWEIGDDLSSYDDMDAWPTLIDEFVDFENERTSRNVSS